MADGILNIDGYNWSLLKFSEKQLSVLPEAERSVRRRDEEQTFKRYHARMREWIEGHGGSVWNTLGDCTIAHGFQSVDEAVGAATTIQRRLTDFNLFDNRIGTPLFIRIGVAKGTLPEISLEERGESSLSALDEAGHLQKDCPPGRVRISRATFESLRFGRQDFRPGLSTGLKGCSAGSMVWIERMLTPDELKAGDSLSRRQARSYPPIVVTQDDLVRMGFDKDLSKVPEAISDAVVIIGETRDEGKAVGPVSHAAATSDAVGTLEVFATLQSSSGVMAGIDEWVDTVDLATQRSIVMVGSPVVNLFAYAINRVLMAGFEDVNGGPMRIRIGCGNGHQRFPSAFRHGSSHYHYGLVLFDRSPVNPSHSVLWIAGITGMGTQAAARFARDLVASPDKALGALGTKRPNVVVVKPRWHTGFGPEDYQGMWRVSDYEVEWSGRTDGSV